MKQVVPQKTIRANIRAAVAAGKPFKQAVAIAMRKARPKKSK